MIALAPEGLRWFEECADRYAWDPAGILGESCAVKSLRSVKSLVTQLGFSAVDQWLRERHRRSQELHSWLATPAEVRSRFIPLLEPALERCPFVTTNLNLSRPAGCREAISINVIVRLYDVQGRQQIKIKFGSFEDAGGRLFWEVGFVDVCKTLGQPLEQLLRNLEQNGGDYFFLTRLVDWAKQCIHRRRAVTGLDLTPAFYHVATLCRRMGGVPIDQRVFRCHMQAIEDAFTLYRSGAAHSRAAPSCRRWEISWLLQQGWLRGPKGEVLAWCPPRFLWNGQRAGNIWFSATPVRIRRHGSGD